MMTALERSFIDTFGQPEADLVFKAAREHAWSGRDELTQLVLVMGGVEDTSTDEGDDPFGWAVNIALSYQCMEVARYREHHGFTMPWDNLLAWCRDHRDGLMAANKDDLADKAGSYAELLG